MRLHWRTLALAAALGALAGCSSPAFEVRTYSMGERAHVGKFVYNVFDTQWMTQLGSGPAARIPEHRFFLVRVSVVNSGSEELNVPAMALTADNGDTYTELSNGEGVPQWVGYLRRIRPAEPLQGNVIFDVPPRHYKLKVLDENQQRAALFDIPLTFGSEVPEIAVPGQEKPSQEKK